YSTRSYTVACPADGPHVVVVERDPVHRGGARPIGLRDASVEQGVLDVAVVVVRALLPRGVRGIADDHLDVELLLPHAPRAVVDEHARDEVVLLVELERVREADPLERLVLATD